MNIYHVYFDGSCEPNPNGFAAYGIHIPELDIKISEAIGQGKGMTNNLAEWTAALKSLEYIKEIIDSGDTVILMGDSQLVIRQLTGQYSVSSPKLYPFFKKAQGIIDSFNEMNVQIEFKHIRRDKNKIADILSHIPYMDEKVKVER